MAEHDEDTVFETADAGASHTVPMQAGSIKKNGHVMLKGMPCKVVDYSTSKTGKHGHAKAHIVGIDLFTGKKYEDICPTSHNMEVPHVKKTEHMMIGLSDDSYVSLLLDNGIIKDDLKLPCDSEGALDEVGSNIKAMFGEDRNVIVSVMMACGQEKIIACKEMEKDKKSEKM